MEKLLEMAKKAADQAEVFSSEHASNTVSFKDAKLYNIKTDYLSGMSLRIIKDGKLGFAYTRNLADRRELLDNARRSLEGGVEAPYDMPATTGIKKLDTYDPAITDITSKELVEEAKRICGIVESKAAGEIMAGAFTDRDSLRILNSKGTDVNLQSSIAGTYGSIVFPGSGSGIGRIHQGKRLGLMPDALIDEMADLFKKGQRTIEPKGGRMKVLFMPDSMITLLWRVASGLSGRSVFEKISPLADKMGQRIFSQKLTITDDPLNDHYPLARPFDDEGVACKPLRLIDQGVLENFYFDLNYGKKAGVASTGHGYRAGPWGGDQITTRPGPFPAHLFIKPGSTALAKLISMTDRGIIVEGALGAHSGNIPNGDYSIGVSPGLYVENGQIVGQVKDAMVTGNIYETLANVVELGDTLYPSFGGAWVPPLLCEGVSVTTKS